MFPHGISFRVGCSTERKTPMMTLTVSRAGMELIFSGAMLFQIGLIQGMLIPKFKNSRMALSAHLAAVQSGMALMVFGVIWKLIEIPSPWLGLTERALILSLYLIWFGITISAVTGASKALPIAGKGYVGGKTSEQAVVVIESLGVLLSITSGAAIVLGLANALLI